VIEFLLEVERHFRQAQIALGQPAATVEETGRAFAPFLQRALAALQK
jgi:hypothetical protein